MLKKFLKRICAAFAAAGMLMTPAGALDQNKVVTPFDEVLYQIERYGLFAEGNEMSDADRALCNARIDSGEPLSKVVNEILSKHDTHSFYLSPEEYQQSFSALTGDYVGIGVTVQLLDGSLIVTDINFGGPAREAGIETGDILLAVDGVSINGKSLDEVGSLLRGEPGTTVRIKLDHLGKELEVMVSRREIYGDYVWSETLEDGIEYIGVQAFGSMDDAEHFLTIWDGLDEKRTAAVIIDLRGNGGGVIDAALAMLDGILQQKTGLVSLRWRKDQGGTQVVTSNGGGLPLNGIYVLVDGQTASAAELMAVCLKDSGEAELVGEKTYGKSLGQFHLSTKNGDSLIITTLEMSAPKSGVWEEKGIVPTTVTESMVTLGDYLTDKAPLPDTRPLFFGETGSAVRELTERLRLLGLLERSSDTLGAEAMKGVHKFQAAAGLPETIHADVTTLKRLNSVMKDYAAYYVDNALEQALIRAREAAQKPLQYTPKSDGTWTPAA